MGSKLTPLEKKIWRRFDEILYYRWDPIGVSDRVQTRDEYSTYLPQLFSLVMESRPWEEIESHMAQIVEERIGLVSNKDKNLEIIRLLFGCREFLESIEQSRV